MQGSSSFLMKPCILITYQIHVPTSKYLALPQEKTSCHSQYHNIDNILFSNQSNFIGLYLLVCAFFVLKIHLHPIDFISSDESTSVHIPLTFMDSISDFMVSSHLLESDLCIASIQMIGSSLFSLSSIRSHPRSRKYSICLTNAVHYRIFLMIPLQQILDLI